MKRFLNRFSTEERVSIILKTLAIGILAMLMLGCKSLDFRLGTMQVQSRYQQPVEIQTTIIKTTHQVFSELDPWDLGLSFGGNWVHCRTHGFHDLNDWTDFSFSPYFCRPSHGFLSGSRWNSNWGGMNQWNPRFNYLGYAPHRWSPFGYDRWGYNNWMGNVYYGNRWNNYYGWNNNYMPYNWRRSNINGRRGNVSPRTRSTRVIRTRPTRTRTIPNNVRPTRTPIPNNVRTIRTPIRRSDVKPPIRTNTRPNNTRPTIRNNNTRPSYNTRPSNNTRPRINNTNTTRSRSTNVNRSTTSRGGNSARRQ